MEFVHQPYKPGETIAALATPPGEGGVAIIRISGNNAFEIAAKVYSGPIHSYKSHTAHFGKIIDAQNNHIDDVLLLVFKDGRSYTGENTVEIHCHGGSLISRKVLDTVLAAGARGAKPGEFTFRAFINGKLDLAQAEAVQELICAKNEHALNCAENQLQGSLSQKVISFQEKITTIAAILEAWVDFPEEGLEFASMEEISRDLSSICQEIESLISTFHNGKIVQEGVSLCLVGAPNVGKSSLMNALLDKDRAIVSDIPGTTRDLLEDHLRLNGLNFRLVDTAGIRDTAESIEAEGIRRSKKALKESDLTLLILDASRPNEEESLSLLCEISPQKTIIVWNKIDLITDDLPDFSLPHVISLSAKHKIGLDKLHAKIDQVIWEKGPPSKEEIVVTNVRHKEALVNALSSCKKVLKGLLEGISPEFLMIDIREALTHLGQIIGTNISEEILSSIFSKFCIGK